MPFGPVDAAEHLVQDFLPRVRGLRSPSSLPMAGTRGALIARLMAYPPISRVAIPATSASPVFAQSSAALEQRGGRRAGGVGPRQDIDRLDPPPATQPGGRSP